MLTLTGLQPQSAERCQLSTPWSGEPAGPSSRAVSSVSKPVGTSKVAAISRAKAIFDKHFEWDARLNGELEPRRGVSSP